MLHLTIPCCTTPLHSPSGRRTPCWEQPTHRSAPRSIVLNLICVIHFTFNSSIKNFIVSQETLEDYSYLGKFLPNHLKQYLYIPCPCCGAGIIIITAPLIKLGVFRVYLVSGVPCCGCQGVVCSVFSVQSSTVQ
jgi:hypothetical protein